jgi:hypothetical protein
MTKLIADKSVFYGGRTHRKGDTFDAPTAHASLLIRTRQVRAYVEEAEEAATVTKPRRRYKRRDMRAEV